MILEHPLGSIWRFSGQPKSQIKVPFSPEAPRKAPGRDSGSIVDPCLVDLKYFGCMFGSVFNDVLVML